MANGQKPDHKITHMSLGSHLRQIVRWDAARAGGSVRTVTVDLIGAARKRVGRVSGVLAADADPRIGDALAAHVEDAVERGVGEALRRLSERAGAAEIWEAAVASANRSLALVLGEHGLPISPDLVCAALVAQRDGAICVAVWGSPSLLLFRRRQDGTAIIADVLGAAPDATIDPGRRIDAFLEERRMFGSVINGNLALNDRLLVATRDLRETLGAEALAAAVLGPDPDASVEAVTALLRERGDSTAFAAVVLDDGLPRHPQMTRRAGTTRHPEITPGAGYPGTGAGGIQADGIGEDAVREMADRRQKTDDTIAPRILPAVLSGAGAAASTAVRAAKAITEIWKGDPLERATEAVNAMPSLRRGILLAALILIMAANADIAYTRISSALLTAASHREQAVAGVLAAIDDAEASILYRDDQRAIAALTSAESALGALPRKNEADRESAARIEGRLDRARRSFRREAPLPPPAVSAPGLGSPVRRIAFSGKDVLLLTESGDLYRAPANDPADASRLAGDAEWSGAPLLAPTATGVAVGTAAKITHVGGTKTKREMPVQPGADAAPIDAELFGSRLYLLDPARNRIIRLSATENGYAGASVYPKDGTDISSAADMAVDGAIWVLMKDGSVAKLMNGARESFAVPAPEPAVTTATRIVIPASGDSLFILEPSAGRVLRYRMKNGALVSQYVSTDLNDAADFAVADDGTRMLVAKGDTILTFDVPN